MVPVGEKRSGTMGAGSRHCPCEGWHRTALPEQSCCEAMDIQALVLDNKLLAVRSAEC